MKKKQKTTEHRSATGTTGTGTIDLKLLIHDHSLFFDKLVELIPAKFYISNDDDSKPWFQGLSKAAKASAKHQTKENIKKARRDRLDPEKSQTTTLDLLKKSIEVENGTSKSKTDINDDDEADANDNDDDDVVKPIVKFDDDNRSVTYEELRQRLHRRIEELRGNRGTGESSRDERRERRGNEYNKRKREEGELGEKSSGRDIRDGEIEKDVNEATKGIEFGKVKIGGEDEIGMNKKKKRKVSREKELEMAKKLQEAKNDPEKGDVVAKKHSWKAATSRAAGIKVHDDPKLLKQSIHKEKKRHGKNVGKWKERVESREKLKVEKQQKRAGNIAERIQDKKMRKIAKREKKLMRPGFEGRKEGFISGN